MIKEILEKRGYKQQELADKLNTSQPTISQIKNGQNRNPRYNLAAKIIQEYESTQKIH